MQTKDSLVRGRISFSRNKVLLKQGEQEYFIKPFSIERGYVEGDLVEGKVIRIANEWYLAEVSVKRLITRSNISILGSIEKIGFGKVGIRIFREYGNIGIINVQETIRAWYTIGDIVDVIYYKDSNWKIREVIGNMEDPHIDEMMLYRKEWVCIDFPKEVIEEAEWIQQDTMGKESAKSLIPKYITDGLFREYFDPWVKEYFPSLLSRDSEHLRTDFRNIFTMTIDGADAKDLDDAISIARYEWWEYFLTVHIADVSEYVTEWSALDIEALRRTTSIYTPGKVIPMLPEKLSNDLCSLHPWSAKFTLSILMKIDTDGQVLASFITEGIIQSDKRGIYEEIIEWGMNTLNVWVDEKPLGGSGINTVWTKMKSENWWAERGSLSFSTLETFDTFGHKSMEAGSRLPPSHEWQIQTRDIPHLDDFFTLFHILERRRKQEGKIIFESSEPIFMFDQEGNVTNIEKRERWASHKMIEEFMVLANEEVAKWCAKRHLPFLSRIHHFPPQENLKIIQEIIGYTASRKDITPWDIRTFLDQYSKGEVGSGKLKIWNNWDGENSRSWIDENLQIGNDIALYRFSRLMLPKMAKAFYSDTALMHFGLALEFYSHFTSPIRRYPDLQIHRIIKEELRWELSSDRKKHYRSLLKKIAKKCSDGENLATSIERSVDAIMICRYMQKRIGQSFSGRVSGLAEWAIFVELKSGVEVTVYTDKWRSHGRYIVDPVRGTLSLGQKILYTIGDELVVKVVGINSEEKRVEGSIVNLG